ncbi:DNA photolyase family protein [Actinocorallia sp. API 0066]|uniref:cryptochrome/photolyase family protein n=1 Tax=Actinocorallia sp. API 0066 TaxID=2896846 RepID=UPI001E42A73B|nr:deoxyribodipyrimidine photo-lyase [Actinocorallia sp. API 0066]MCD0448953.1 DNA photolyase family protein [Actinocorallia sp. API 0066]
METSIVVLTRDLRVHDQPGLVEGCARGRVVPLFVVDEEIVGGVMGVPNRLRFLGEALADLREGLRGLGGELIVRRGSPAREVARLAEQTGARVVRIADDRSRFALRRLDALRGTGLDVRTYPGVTVVPPGAVTPAGGDHYKVFTPYWKAWAAAEWRTPCPVPGRVDVPEGIDAGVIPDLAPKGVSPGVAKGGESEARRLMREWLANGVAAYDGTRDDLANPEGTSRLSAHLRFGCLSPLELASAVREHEPFLRQLAWRDFHHQVAAAFPDLPRRDYRPRGHRWRDDPEALAAWREGRTGVPIVDAGMRQLRHEGFMHNRTRMITASYLTRDLGIDWRHGYRHFRDLLTDADLANNPGNWQWVAGTGNDTRPNRTLNPVRQSLRHDPTATYLHHWLPELAHLPTPATHHPWTLESPPPNYPPPLTHP